MTAGNAVRAGLAAMALVAVGCGTPDPEGARSATESFYRAVEADDGAAACRQLSRSTLEALEEEQEQSCPRAVLAAEVETSGAAVLHVQPAVTEAAVELANGSFVFLDRSSGRWEISAADCQPNPDNEPFDCAVEG